MRTARSLHRDDANAPPEFRFAPKLKPNPVRRPIAKPRKSRALPVLLGLMVTLTTTLTLTTTSTAGVTPTPTAGVSTSSGVTPTTTLKVTESARNVLAQVIARLRGHTKDSVRTLHTVFGQAQGHPHQP